jgi:hypothetical protein
MRTGSFHRTISPLSIRTARLPTPLLNPSSGSMDMRASTRWSNPPTWPLRSARRFQAIKSNDQYNRHLN